MDERLSFEIKRKIIHSFSVVYILIYYYVAKYFSHKTALLCLLFIFILLLFIEFVKIRYRKKIPLFEPIYREKEKYRISGSVYLVLGVIITFSVFDFEIAVVSLLMMIFGDMAATLVGMSLGKHWTRNIPGVAWEGIIAEFIVDVLVGFLFLKNAIAILAMALTATFIEAVLNSTDDNLAVPALSGFAGQSVLIFLKLFRLI